MSYPIGTFTSKNIRAAAILTNAYVAATVVDVSTANQLQILADFTIGSLTSCDLKLEWSLDNTTFYQEAYDSVSNGTNTENLGVRRFTATGKYQLSVPILGQFLKISAIGNGTVSTSSIKIDLIYGVV